MKKISLLILSLWLLFSFGCGENEAQSKGDSPKQNAKSVHNNLAKADSTKLAAAKVTFIELGSVNCIPCKAMQPIMRAVEEDYGDQIEVIFYDVWKDPTPARKFRIRLIPTQVFLDEAGNEFFRHEGILPKENIDSLLVKRGLKIKSKTEAKTL